MIAAENTFNVPQAFDNYVYDYGKLKKIDAIGYLDFLKQNPDAERKQGKVILVTADTPLLASRGEGKTTTTIALIDALRTRGIDAAAVLRQPSMGITAAGSKGGASGGGKASLADAELADWGLTGEMARIENAQNLLVAFCEKAVDDGVLDEIMIPRVSETPSRSLRKVAVDGGKIAERFVLTPASELMQIVTLSRSIEELSIRIGNMIAGLLAGKTVKVSDFVDVERVVRVIGDAVQPALMRTAEGAPVYIHCGPFGNVSLGIPGLTAVDLACALHEVVVVEAGYGTDAGAQKWLDVAAREYDAQWPAAAVVVTRATTWQDDPQLQWRYPFHVNRLESLGIPAFPLINLWEGEDDQIPALKEQAAKLGFRTPILGNLFRDGGKGIKNQLDEFISAVSGLSGISSYDEEEKHQKPESFAGKPLRENLNWVINSAYGVPTERVLLKDGYEASEAAARELCAQIGVNLDDLALVSVKSPATMTDNDSAPVEEHTVTLKKVEVHGGAGIVQVNLTTSLTTPMPKIV